MNITDILEPSGVDSSLRAGTKAQVLSLLAQRAAAAVQIDGTRVFELLMARESLGTTAVGHGIALPHTQIPGLNRFHGQFARLLTPVDFGAADLRPVDLVFLLLIPENAGKQHLVALASVSRQLRRLEIVNRLRAAKLNAELYAALTDAAGSVKGL